MMVRTSGAKERITEETERTSGAKERISEATDRPPKRRKEPLKQRIDPPNDG